MGYIESKGMGDLSRMIYLPYYVVENIEALENIGVSNYQNIYRNALGLKSEIETIKKVVERNKNADKVDKELNRLGIKLSDIEFNIKNLFNRLHQDITNKMNIIRNAYNGLELEALDEYKYNTFISMRSDNFDINVLDYMVKYIKSTKEESEKIMKGMINELKGMIEGLVKKNVLNDGNIREIKNEEYLSRERILSLENYIINNSYHKVKRLNVAMEGLLGEISKVSKNLGIRIVKIDGKNEEVFKIIDRIRDKDLSKIRINQNDIKGGMEDCKRIYELYMNFVDGS